MYPQETHLLSSALNPLSPLHSPHKYPVRQHQLKMTVYIQMSGKEIPMQLIMNFMFLHEILEQLHGQYNYSNN